MPHACEDCVDVYGDTPAAWLEQCPAGAEYRPDFDAYLCDGCTEAREEYARENYGCDNAGDEYDMYGA